MALEEGLLGVQRCHPVGVVPVESPVSFHELQVHGNISNTPSPHDGQHAAHDRARPGKGVAAPGSEIKIPQNLVKNTGVAAGA